MTVLVGTSGWQYRHWRYTYFRKGVPQNKWFEQVLRDFRTVELNVTFYRLPRSEVFAGWYARSPDDAVITVKASSYLTHVKRLRDPQPSVDMLMDRIRPLQRKLGPILVQLPSSPGGTFPDGNDVYVYFNNDPGTAAIDNAMTFADQLAGRGCDVTRIPAERPDLAAAGP